MAYHRAIPGLLARRTSGSSRLCQSL